MRVVTKLIIFVVLLMFPFSALCADAPQVKIETNMGDIVLELNPDRAPITTENFLKYVENGHYNGTIFHRVIDGFMIQGGGLDENMHEKDTAFAPIQNEAANGLKNERYTIAMARTNKPHSATAQFFINVENNDFLDYPGQDGWGYAVFGKVIEGQSVVDKIMKVKTENEGIHKNVPLENVQILKASIIR